MLPYGLVWDGIRIRLRRAVRDGACGIRDPRDGVPLRRRRVAPRWAHGSGSGSDWRTHRSGSGTRGVRLPLRNGATRLRVTKLDRLEKRGGDGQAVSPGGYWIGESAFNATGGS